ncbi:MAG TPA: hypothetical protein VGM44_10310, partial [Polyangiaceae bacterium]
KQSDKNKTAYQDRIEILRPPERAPDVARQSANAVALSNPGWRPRKWRGAGTGNGGSSLRAPSAIQYDDRRERGRAAMQCAVVADAKPSDTEHAPVRRLFDDAN